MIGMRVVIAGASGNVGTSLVECLREEARVDEIVALSRRPPSWTPAKTTWVRADIARDDLSTVFAGADAVVNLAWIFQPTHRPRLTWDNNVTGSMRVFDAALAASVPKIVHASSVAAYSPRTSDDPVDETWPTHSVPTAAYGREKAYLERVLDTLELAHPGIRVIRMRPGFIFKRSSAESQRRIFAGPLLPNPLVRRATVPVLPVPRGMRFQALHSSDAGEAYRSALVEDVRGPFNIAADPPIDAEMLGALFQARTVAVPAHAARVVLHALWRARAVPASPFLLDLAMSLPVMDTTRAREELAWKPRVDARAALADVLDGIRTGSGGRTPPLDEAAGGALRHRELASGVGGMGGVTADGR
jgi:UDP-glucose 4-epimerase